jgi:hypothetical protein
MRLTYKKAMLLLQAALLVAIVTGCKKNTTILQSVKSSKLSASKSLSLLLQQKTQVFIGIADSVPNQANPANYNQWTYSRTNADGYYTNFIVMYNNNQAGNAQQTMNNMRSAFVNNGCFFETSLETALNNSQTTDESNIDMLTTASFNVNVASLNYGYDAGRVSTLRTYKNTRPCLAIEGAWTFGGDINSSANAQVRSDILNEDGVELDGPMGLWYANSNNMQNATYTTVQFAHSHGLKAALMLAPYAAGVSGYTATNNFFSTSKDCVLKCEDNNAVPDMWTIWTYGEDPGQHVFPESTTTGGVTSPANTLMGVGYWLLKHLNNLPQMQITNGSVGNNTTVSQVNSTQTQVSMNTVGDTTSFYSMPVTFSNSSDPQIEISPVISAAITGDTGNWQITFSAGGVDVTNDVISNGGLNCISTKRITSTNSLNLMVNIKALNQAAQPLTITFKNMANAGNASKYSNYTIVAQTQSGLVNGGHYEITNQYNGKVLDFVGAGTTNGTLADLYDWNATTCQHIRLDPQTGGSYQLTPMHATDKCLDVPGASTANGVQAQLYTANGTNAQKWTITALGNGFYKIINVNSGKALEDYGFGTANGSIADQWDYNGGVNQQWKFTYLAN